MINCIKWGYMVYVIMGFGNDFFGMLGCGIENCGGKIKSMVGCCVGKGFGSFM